MWWEILEEISHQQPEAEDDHTHQYKQEAKLMYCKSRYGGTSLEESIEIYVHSHRNNMKMTA